MRLRYVCVLTLGFGLLAGCSEKGPDVEKVKQDFTAEMNVMAGPDGRYLGFDGVDAVPDGDKVKVTIKGVKLIVPGAEPLTIGDIEMRATPKGEDQYEITDAKIPSRITFKGPEGDINIEIGSQAWSGILSTKYHTFLSADGTYGGLKVSGPALAGSTVELAEIAFKSTSEDKGDGVFDQATTGTLKSLSITGPEGSGVFSGGAFQSEIKGAKLADLRAFGADWQALVMGVGEGKPADPALVERLKGYVGIIGSLTTHADLTGMTVKDMAGTEMFSAERLVLDGGGTALDQPKAAFSFDMSVVGLTIPAASLDPMAAQHKQFIPTLVKFGYALDDLPTKELWAAWLDLMASGVLQPGQEMAAEMAMQGFGMQLIQLANQSGSAFRITGLELEAPAARVKMDGSIKGDMASPLGAAGSANVEIAGLDAMAEAVKQSMPPEEAAGAGGAFDILRGFSTRETVADGTTIDRYAIVLAPTGEMTINNKPFDLFGMMMGGAPQ